MSIRVQTADLQRDREIIIDALARCLTPSSDDERFEWLYGQNPQGQPRAWLAVDEANNSIVGAAAAFPRRFYFGSEETVGWVLGDFCLDPAYRSLGPALQLQRACLSVLDQHEAAFCYDFPSTSMVAVYKRLGFDATGELLRLAKPLRVDRTVKKMIESSAVQRVVSSVGNALLKIVSRGVATDQTVDLSLHQGLCGEEFTVLAEEQRENFGNCLRRSAEYLNWRYVNNPVAHHEIITARRRGRLIGYAVWTQTEEDAWIVDLFGETASTIMRCLVSEITALAQKRDVMTLCVSVNESHPWISLLSEMGFRIRDSVPVIIIPGKSCGGKIDPRLTRWYLMVGDRDS